jgi:hypothetical protein
MIPAAVSGCHLRKAFATKAAPVAQREFRAAPFTLSTTNRQVL